MNYIAIFAIDKIVEIKNTSVLTNEQLIQRLCFIPLVSDTIDQYTIFNECKCLKNCEKCSIPFSIDVINNTQENITVYSDSIRIENNSVKVFQQTKYSIPITKLCPGQEFIVKGYIKKGMGKHHSKYSPVWGTFYKFMPVVKVKNSSSLSREDKEKLVKVCPMSVFSLNTSATTTTTASVKKGKKNTSTSVQDIEDIGIAQEKCTLCNECVYTFPEHVELGFDNSTIVFNVESTGSLKVDKIINESIEYLKNI
jgi:DNA-directed RNA polymerase alpha subunit